MDASQLLEHVVRPTLEAINLAPRFRDLGEKLVLGTCAHESGGFRYIHQVRGPALGIAQIEPATYYDTIDRSPRAALDRLCEVSGVAEPSVSFLVYNLRFCVGLCRLVYYLKPFSMSRVQADMDGGRSEAEALAIIWKLHYNTPLGAGTTAQFVRSYERFVAPLF